jgi:hypothetical protein
MKNVHLIPTDNPSRLGRIVATNNLFLKVQNDLPRGENVHVYITVDDTIKIGDREIIDNECRKLKFTKNETRIGKKVILSDDPTLIDSGVQAIPNDFLEFLVQNPSCESVEFEKEHDDTVPYPKMRYVEPYKIVLPKEEPKQTDEKGKPLTYWGGLKEPKQEATMKETIEEAAEDYFLFNIFCDDITDFEHVVATRCFTAGAKSDAAREMWHKKFKHESINALKAIENLCDSQNPTHEDIWRIAYGVINDLTGKE